MVAAVTALAKLAGLWIEKTEDLAARAQLEADAQKVEIKTAANMLGEAAESLGLPRTATPAQIVGALSERRTRVTCEIAWTRWRKPLLRVDPCGGAFPIK